VNLSFPAAIPMKPHDFCETNLVKRKHLMEKSEMFCKVKSRRCYAARICFLALASVFGAHVCRAEATHNTAKVSSLQVQVSKSDGLYSIGGADLAADTLKAGVAVQVDGRWLHARDYSTHNVIESDTTDDFGPVHEWTVTYSGLRTGPDLEYKLRVCRDKSFGDIQVVVRNSTTDIVHVQSIRPMESSGNAVLDLGGPVQQDRVLSDSFSEDRPDMKIRDIGDSIHNVHRGIGSQLIYNRRSHKSFFVGALTSEHFLTVLRIHMAGSADKPTVDSYEVDSTGTTELAKENSLRKSPAADQVELSLPVAPGEQLISERLLFSVDNDYHRQLEFYGSLIRQLHHARVSAPTPMGWWSWTAYYFGLNEQTALTNAQWLSEHLRSFGYNFFHIDEGYQYARGEYITPDAALFPHGIADFERKVSNQGLVSGIWTAPFEVSERSWVYQTHPEWLVRNANDQPIHIGWVDHRSKDQLFALDTTNPGAQDYLRKTYSALVNDWGIRYIKLDFMEDSGVEGYYYRPSTTAFEAQRIGLGIIREAVGENTLLDKDGSEMLNPVGYVDMGRIAGDTGHAFDDTKVAAPAVAARYYMNRNFFVADPDAFNVSAQTVDAHDSGQQALSLDEAKVSIALSAVSGGMYEIGDDLPSLGAQSDRVALVQNQDLIDMARLGIASTPIDLMDYVPEDEQPSIFFLKENTRQSILTVFNWTQKTRTHIVELSSLGLVPNSTYKIFDALDQALVFEPKLDALVVEQPPHSVQILKIVNAEIPVGHPGVKAQRIIGGKAGILLNFDSELESNNEPVITYRWDFGDGVTIEGKRVTHAYTHAGDYEVRLISVGLGGITSEDKFTVKVSDSITTTFAPENKRRF
jgi:hypothetical protein